MRHVLYKCDKCKASSEHKALVKDKKGNKCCPNCKAPILITMDEFFKELEELVETGKKLSEENDFCGRRKHA